MPTWIRVRDNATGHEYDLHEDDPRIDGDAVTVLKDYPENSGPTAQPRDAKHRVELGRAQAQQYTGADLPTADAAVAAAAENAAPYSEWTKDALQDEVRRRNDTRSGDAERINVTGTVPELVERLEADDANEDDSQ